MAAFVENASDRSKAFLTSCVPNLELYQLVVDLHNKVPEFHPNRHVVLLLEDVLNKSPEEATLAHTYTITVLMLTCVSNDDDFKERIVVLLVISVLFDDSGLQRSKLRFRTLVHCYYIY